MAEVMAHTGGLVVSREQVDAVEAPVGTGTWYPTAHKRVLLAVESNLASAGFEIKKSNYVLAREGKRMFATLDLASFLAPGVSLAVGVRNSNDKSFPLGFCAGNRVFVCDNLAFSSELAVARRHTRWGSDRFREAIALAVGGLSAFRSAETTRIQKMQDRPLTDTEAESLILRGYRQGILSKMTLDSCIEQWHTPGFAEFKGRTAWSLYNAFTWAVRGRARSDSQKHADITMRLGGLFALAA